MTVELDGLRKWGLRRVLDALRRPETGAGERWGSRPYSTSCSRQSRAQALLLAVVGATGERGGERGGAVTLRSQVAVYSLASNTARQLAAGARPDCVGDWARRADHLVGRGPMTRCQAPKAASLNESLREGPKKVG